MNDHNPIPVTPETLPDPRIVDFARWKLEHDRKAANERDARRQQAMQRALQPRDDGPEAA